MRNFDLNAFDPLATAEGRREIHSPLDSQHHIDTRDVGLLPAVRPLATGVHSSQGEYLERMGFSSGLARAIGNIKSSFPIRYWILDNSTQMNVRDSHRISLGDKGFFSIDGTRWEELQECVGYHSQLAATLSLPMKFCLLNDPGAGVGPQYFSVGEQQQHGNISLCEGLQREMAIVKTVMTRTNPKGPSSLSNVILQLQKHLITIADGLRQRNQTVAIVLATQGLPSDDQGGCGQEQTQHFLRALRSLEGLPVCVVVRLCTDDERALEFYNNLDTQFGALSYEVLDDYFGESLEVYLRNPWLNYALPLHRFRETGFLFEALDKIDEQPLTLREVREVCLLLFDIPRGNAMNPHQQPISLPDPEIAWNAFLNALSVVLAREKQQWNPVTRKLAPWINLRDLDRIYNNNNNNRLHKSNTIFASSFPLPQRGPPQQHEQPQHAPTPSQPPPPPSGFGQQPSQRNAAPPATVSAVPPTAPPSAKVHPQIPAPQSPGAASDLTELKRSILMRWALEPPQFQSLKSIGSLLGTTHCALPPAFCGVPPHDYFAKWIPLSSETLASGGEVVLKRAVRKIKFFLHPDKLPKDLTEGQAFLCKTLWDVTADAWTIHTDGRMN